MALSEFDRTIVVSSLAVGKKHRHACGLLGPPIEAESASRRKSRLGNAAGHHFGDRRQTE
jgi:hypothetical protein